MFAARTAHRSAVTTGRRSMPRGLSNRDENVTRAVTLCDDGVLRSKALQEESSLRNRALWGRCVENRTSNRIAAIGVVASSAKTLHAQECDRSKPGVGGLCVCRLCNRFGALNNTRRDLGGARREKSSNSVFFFFQFILIADWSRHFCKLRGATFFCSPAALTAPNCSYYKLKLREKKPLSQRLLARAPVGQHSLLFHRRRRRFSLSYG